MKFFLLAFRNVFRNKRRTLITFLTIVSGMVALITFGGFVENAFWTLRELTIHTQLGHIQVFKKGYSEQGVANPQAYLINDYAKVEALLYTLPGVKLVTERISFSGLVSTGDKTLVCKGEGVISEKEAQLASFEKIIAGQNLSLTASVEDEAVLGSELAKSLQANIGDYLTVVTSSPSGMMNARDLKLVGIGQSGASDYDAVFMKIPLKTAQSLLSENAVEKMVILLNNTEDTIQVCDKLAALIEDNHLDLEYRNWKQLSAYYNAVVGLYNGIFNVVKIIVAAVVFFSIANTMTMAIFERVREIGTLRAIGTQKSGIILLFLWEGFLVGLLGGILGMIAGSLVALAINLCGGIYIPPPPGMNISYQAYIFVVPSVLFYSFFLTLLVSTVSALYPAFKVINFNVVEALRHN